MRWYCGLSLVHVLAIYQLALRPDYDVEVVHCISYPIRVAVRGYMAVSAHGLSSSLLMTGILVTEWGPGPHLSN
jgi:hypothetical protein